MSEIKPSQSKLTYTGGPRPQTGRDPDIAVVTCALTGVLASRKQNEGIPYTPAEIGEEAKRAYDAGASVVHIHARNDDGSPTFAPAVFARIKDEVRKRSPIILNYSTGTILDDTTEQETYVRECRPEIAALNMGTMNYSKYSRARKAFDFRHGLSQHLRKDRQAPPGDERRGREARARVLRLRSHPWRLAAARHGCARASAAVLVHRQRPGRHPRID